MKLPLKESVFSKPKIEEKKKLKNERLKEKVAPENSEEIKSNRSFSFGLGFLKNRPNLKAAFLVTFFLLVSKALGFLRGLLIYHKMDEEYSDLLIAATKIPEILTLVLIMGTVISSVLPMASKVKEKIDEKKMVDYMNLIQAPLIIGVGLISIVFFVFTKDILQLSTSLQYWDSFQEKGLIDDYVLAARVLLLGPIFFALQSFFGVFLSIKKRFGIYSTAGVLYNIGAIAGILIAGQNGAIEAAFGMTIGAGFAALIFWGYSLLLGFNHKGLFRLKYNYKFFKKEFWKTWKVFIPRMFLINGLVASGLMINKLAENTDGQITAFEIGIAIQTVFFAFISSVGTVIFPDLSEDWNSREDRKGRFWKRLKMYSNKVALVAIFGSVITFFAAPLVMWIFELFGDGQDNADYIIYLARILTLALVLQSVNEVLNKYFYVRQRVAEPVLVSVSGLIAQIVFSFYMVDAGYDAGMAVGLGVFVNNLVVLILSVSYIGRDYKIEKIRVANKVEESKEEVSI